jgi:hypothetical protein
MCERCGKESPNQKKGTWCPICEREYDTWVRRYASDIIWVVLGGGVVLGAAGILVPLIGLPPLLAIGGAFLGWGTILGAGRLNARRRRLQFLRGGDLPRAYLPAPK